MAGLARETGLLSGTMCSHVRWAPRLLVGLVLAAPLAGCSASESSRPPSTVQADPVTTVAQSTTTTTVPSILPVEGTIPLAGLADARRGDDLTATAQRALAVWRDAPVECYPSKAEASAARDQFARVATYLGAVRAAARVLADVPSFKEAIATEAAYRDFAATRPFVVCNAPTRPSVGAPTTTMAGGTTKGLAAGGVVEITLALSGDPAADREFTVSDAGAACDGVSANTTFLVSSQDASGRWAITDVIVNPNGATSATIIPARAGAGAIEYLAYCGTQDKRHGVVTYRVRPTGDTTTTAPAPTTTDPTAPLVVLDLPVDDTAVAIDPRATEVAVEPEVVREFLTTSGADGGVVLARINLGEWVALREEQVTWVPIGPGNDGLETKIVGAKAPVERTIRLTEPSTTTSSTSSSTIAPDGASTTLVATPLASRRSPVDRTMLVIGVLLGCAVLAVVLSRARMRR